MGTWSFLIVRARVPQKQEADDPVITEAELVSQRY
jgi:hypothetical protein